MTTPLALLGAADLAARWSYTRQGVHQLAARPGLLTPVAAVNEGRIWVWDHYQDQEKARQEP